jgi:hypothetical protein
VLAREYPLDRFYGYTRPRLTDPSLVRILDTLDEREYAHAPRIQYQVLLGTKGDLKKFHSLMGCPIGTSAELMLNLR